MIEIKTNDDVFNELKLRNQIEEEQEKKRNIKLNYHCVITTFLYT